MSPVRVLQSVTIMNRGGPETMLMNYYRKTDRSKVLFDFLTHRPERGAYDDEIESLAIDSRNFWGASGYPRQLEAFFNARKEYRVLHSHLDALSCFALAAAQKGGVPVRIAHSRNTDFAGAGLKKLFKRYCRSRLRKEGLCTDFFACGADAGKFLFGGDITKGERAKNSA